ncbi:unnamed protein product [Symbiodinium sp. CCMP2592]|nr:unnamed protein product [Symbiodinium sp. CCMP2592]
MARELQAELSPMAEWAQSGSKASVDALMNSWCTRLESLGSLSLGQAMQMKQTIQDLSFESTLSERLLEKVEAKVLATATAATPPPDTTYTPNKRKEESKPQTLLKPGNFITVTEWSMLEKNLTEQTVKKGLAFLLALAAGELSQMPTYEEIYEEVQVFKLPRPDGQAAVSEQHANEFQSRMEQCFGRLERLLDQGCGQNAIQDGGRRELQLAAGANILQRTPGRNSITGGDLSSSSAGVGFALGNPAQAVSAATQQTSPGRQSALQLALPPAEEPEATESLPAENDLEDEDLFRKLKDRKAGILKKPAAAAAASGQGNLAKNKTKTNGQGQDPKKKGKGKGKGKSKDKSASKKGQGKAKEQQAQGSHGKRKFQIVWEDGCIQKNYASRMSKRAGTWAKQQGFSEQQVVECQREAHREAILLWKKKNGC